MAIHTGNWQQPQAPEDANCPFNRRQDLPNASVTSSELRSDTPDIAILVNHLSFLEPSLMASDDPNVIEQLRLRDRMGDSEESTLVSEGRLIDVDVHAVHSLIGLGMSG